MPSFQINCELINYYNMSTNYSLHNTLIEQQQTLWLLKSL